METKKPRRGIKKGDQYGYLTAISDMRVDSVGYPRWKFKCKCGNVVTRAVGGVKSGSSRSCGCMPTHDPERDVVILIGDKSTTAETKQKRGIRKGEVYGRLTVVKYVEMCDKGNSKWLFKCECGNEVIRHGYNVKSGMTRSCGCLHKEAVTSHGRNGTPEHNTWRFITKRCKEDSGITMPSVWKYSFSAFLEDMGAKPSPDHGLYRIDKKLGYSKSNCRWGTKSDQMSTSRGGGVALYHGEYCLLTNIAADLNSNVITLRKWLDRGLTIDEIKTYLLSNMRLKQAVVETYQVDVKMDYADPLLHFAEQYKHHNWIIVSCTVEGDTVTYKLVVKQKQ